MKRSRKPLWKIHLEINRKQNLKLKPQPKSPAPRGRVMALYPSYVWDEDKAFKPGRLVAAGEWW